MDIALSTGHSPVDTRLMISGKLNIMVSESIPEDIVALIDRNDPFDIDLKDVTDIDTFGIQFLLIANRQAKTKEQTMRVINVPTEHQELFKFLHLDKHFDWEPDRDDG